MSSGRPPPSMTPVPPKVSQTKGPSTRRQSANSISPAFEGHNASDEPSARKLLVEHGFLSLNTDPSHTQICNTLLCLTFATGVNTQVADVIRATALIVESLSPGIPTPAEATPPALAPMQQQIDCLTMIIDEIKAATDSNSKSAVTIAELTESTKKELESTSLNVLRAANAHASNLASSPSPPPATGPQKASYANIARYSTHAKAVMVASYLSSSYLMSAPILSYLSSSYLISAPILSNPGAHLISYLIYGCGLVSSSRTFWNVPLHSDVIDDIT